MEQMVSEERMHAFKLVDLGCMYKERVRELFEHTPDRVHTTKLKNRLMAHVEGLGEFKNMKYSYMTFDENVGTVLKSFFEKNYDDEAFILSGAEKILRRDIFSKGNNEFDGTFSANCQEDFSPQSLKSFLDNLLQGNKINSSHTHLEQSTLTISQILCITVKRLRQYTNTTEMHRAKSRESPLEIYLGMLVHAYTRKKSSVDKLYELGISISYKRVMELSTMIGNRVLRQYDSEILVCPPTLRLNVFTTAALDNIDHNPSSTVSRVFPWKWDITFP